MAGRPVGRKSGASAVGLLVTLLVLGGIAGAVFALQPGTKTSPGAAKTATTINASPAKAGSNISQAAQEACQTNYQAVQTAVSAYEALHSQHPATMKELASMIRGPVSTYFYAITIDPHHPGRIDVSTPGHAETPGDAACRFAG